MIMEPIPEFQGSVGDVPNLDFRELGKQSAIRDFPQRSGYESDESVVSPMSPYHDNPPIPDKLVGAIGQPPVRGDGVADSS